MEPIRVGPVPPGRGTPTAYITIEFDGQPRARVDAYASYGGTPFQEATGWKRFVVLGWCDKAYLVDVESRMTCEFDCQPYFSGLYPLSDLLLVASGGGIRCLDADGRSLWLQDNLGVDGVIVHRVENGVVEGDGQWDPPGGWLPFRLDLATGDKL